MAPNNRKGCVFVLGESSETTWEGKRRKKWGRMGLRGLPAFVQQVKWPDSEKPAEKLILVQRDGALIQASGRKRAWLRIQAFEGSNLHHYPLTI